MGPNLTFAKVDGKWMVRGPSNLFAGGEYQVTKRDGSKSKVKLGNRVSMDGETALYAVADQPRQHKSGGRLSYQRSTGAGAAASVRGYSSYCTGRSDCGCYDCSQF